MRLHVGQGFVALRQQFKKLPTIELEAVMLPLAHYCQRHVWIELFMQDRY